MLTPLPDVYSQEIVFVRVVQEISFAVNSNNNKTSVGIDETSIKVIAAR